ncbi:hypothetical protein ACWGHD_19060 [Streptomyces xanthophaeus]
MILVRQRTILEFASSSCSGTVEVRTRDIGATIGTELLYGGVRIAAYRPGTRHVGTAESIAAEHLKAALRRVDADGIRPGAFVSTLLTRRLRDVLNEEKCGSWNPDEYDDEEEDEWT